jgi:gas vesicle protein
MSENNGTQFSSTLAAFAIGALAGAGLALLFAPHSGQETRDVLAQKGRDVKDRAEQALNDAKSLLNNKKTEIVAAVEAAKSAMRDERSRQSTPG